jgi:hypothetical protein
MVLNRKKKKRVGNAVGELLSVVRSGKQPTQRGGEKKRLFSNCYSYMNF